MAAIKRANGSHVELWQGRTAAGGTCLLTHYGAASSADPAAIGNGGGFCQASSAPPQRKPLEAGISLVKDGDGYAVVANARVAPSSGIRSLVLENGSQTEAVRLTGRYALIELPNSQRATDFTDTADAYVLVGLDAHGARVASLDLTALLRSAGR